MGMLQLGGGTSPPPSLFTDGLHLSGEGNRFLFKLLVTTLQSQLGWGLPAEPYDRWPAGVMPYHFPMSPYETIIRNGSALSCAWPRAGTTDHCVGPRASS